nr:M4 family metallopeptidase [Kofleriaceae bacterium]
MRNLFSLASVLAITAVGASCSTPDDAGDPRATTADAATAPSPTIDAAMASLHARRAALGLDDDHTFIVRKVHVDAVGGSHVRVQQLYRGVPVIGGTATLHLAADGSERELTDALLRGVAVDTTAQLTAADARARTEAFLHPGDYVGAPRIALAILPVRGSSRRKPDAAPRSQLVENAADFERPITGYRLIYDVHTAEKHPKRELHTFVDAHTGDIVAQRSGSAHFTATGDARTFFSKATASELPIDVDGPGANGDAFQLEDPVRGGAQCWDEDLDGPPMVSNSGVWGDNKSFVPGSTSRATACADAYWGRTVTWDMAQHVLDWRGTDGDGEGADLGVHDPDNHNNAEFSQWADNIYIGDSNHTGGTMASIDIVGHEYGHAIVNETADLPLGDPGQGGGMNEGTGDIIGALARIYFLKGAHDTLASKIPSTSASEINQFWIHGLDTGFGFRPMFAPSIQYFSTNLDDTEEHAASGPWSRMFFFLANGSTQDVTAATWSHGAPWGMAGIDNDKAARTFFRMLTVYLQSDDEYAQARDRMIDAVRDLFGEHGDEEKAVRNAFAAIDVGDPAVDAPAGPSVAVSNGANGSTSTAQEVDFSTVTPIPGWLKRDVIGTSTDANPKNDFQIRIPCGATFGARLEAAGNYELAIFQSGNSSALASSNSGPNVDNVISLGSKAGCSGPDSTPTKFFVRVLLQAGPLPGAPGVYTLHLDRH